MSPPPQKFKTIFVYDCFKKAFALTEHFQKALLIECL
jgi:hypothetical protein